MDLVHKSNIIDKNSYFIPSGYDRLSVLKSNDTQKDLDCEYSDQIKGEEEEDIMEDEIKCEKLSDYLQKIKTRVYKSRKSLIRDNIIMGKALIDVENIGKKDTESEPKESKEEKRNVPSDKLNKFQKFLEKRDSKAVPEDPESSGKGEKLSKEERAKMTRDSLLNKLRLSKKK